MQWTLSPFIELYTYVLAYLNFIFQFESSFSTAQNSQFYLNCLEHSVCISLKKFQIFEHSNSLTLIHLYSKLGKYIEYRKMSFSPRTKRQFYEPQLCLVWIRVRQNFPLDIQYVVLGFDQPQ